MRAFSLIKNQRHEDIGKLFIDHIVILNPVSTDCSRRDVETRSTLSKIVLYT